MSLFDELGNFKRELQAMNRKLDQIVMLLKMLVELQTEGDDEPDHE